MAGDGTNQPLHILGLDPGLSITGYGVIGTSRGKPCLIEAGVIRVARGRTLSERLKELYDGIQEVLTTVPIGSVAIEQLYSHYERPRTAILMGHARGVLCLAAADAGLAVDSYEATKVKRMLTGSGRAPKSQMQHAVQLQLGLKEPPDPPDVADALAIALCHFFSQSPMARMLASRSRKTN
ncbi:MAG: crossover junction endodeoxyribonuclease RuvC [Planctomycetota bacterium]|jgi:crossover junction endodeoxyribonuclease RuvC